MKEEKEVKENVELPEPEEDENPVPQKVGNDPKAANVSQKLLDEFQRLKEFVGFSADKADEKDEKEENDEEIKTTLEDEPKEEPKSKGTHGCILGVFCPWSNEHEAHA